LQYFKIKTIKLSDKEYSFESVIFAIYEKFDQAAEVADETIAVRNSKL